MTFQERFAPKAARFALEWAKERDEKGEAHSFWDAFFHIFDLERRHFARHESRVARVGKSKGFIDLFWPGKLLVEHKSAHKNREQDWADTLAQALDYIENLPESDRPQVVVLCNFRQFRVFDLNAHKSRGDSKSPPDYPFLIIEITDLPQKIEIFEFIPRFAEKIFEEEEAANLRAIEYMAAIHDVLKKSGYGGRDLELLLVRLLFCLFAEDTGIFEEKQFSRFIETDTLESGSDIGAALIELFEVLNTPMRARPDSVQGRLRQFPYVNGGLFAEPLAAEPPSLMGIRQVILNCAPFAWADISPEIFGSLFQAVLSSAERRSLGAHFTSERNIRRLIEPLFLRDLWAELAECRSEPKKIPAFRRKIGSLHFLDPACGCGNFLVVAYRELRLLDIETLRIEFERTGQMLTDIGSARAVSLAQMHGIEIKPVSALIAQTALWLTDHQCNRVLRNTLGLAVPSIPLSNEGQILTANALLTDWEGLTPDPSPQRRGETKLTPGPSPNGEGRSPALGISTTEEGKSGLPSPFGEGPGVRPFDFIIGNPPFIGANLMDDEQHEQIKTLFDNEPGAGTLDFVSGWYIKAARYMDAHPQTRTAFVSTNSIAQGEQVGALWGRLFERHGMHISFAHQTFKWTNEAPGVAAVFCIIVGFGKAKPKNCLLFEYADIRAEPTETVVKNINPYLVEAGNILIRSRAKPICKVPEMQKGSQPTDNGNLILEDSEKADFLKKEPGAAKFIRPMLSAQEYLKNKPRWCFWLADIQNAEIENLPFLKKRIEDCRAFRLKSPKAATIKWAEKPHLFTENRQPESHFILVPRHSSENRDYVPFGFFDENFIVSDSCSCIPKADLFLFGILTSEMHMAWMRFTCGRIKSDYRYSNTLVYNNFPFPENVGAAEQAAVEQAAQAVLDIRQNHAPKSLAQLYDPNKMPADLLAAHRALDRAVDAAYGLRKNFASEAKRVAWLFERYGELVGAEPRR